MLGVEMPTAPPVAPAAVLPVVLLPLLPLVVVLPLLPPVVALFPGMTVVATLAAAALNAASVLFELVL